LWQSQQNYFKEGSRGDIENQMVALKGWLD